MILWGRLNNRSLPCLRHRPSTSRQGWTPLAQLAQPRSPTRRFAERRRELASELVLGHLARINQ